MYFSSHYFLCFFFQFAIFELQGIPNKDTKIFKKETFSIRNGINNKINNLKPAC